MPVSDPGLRNRAEASVVLDFMALVSLLDPVVPSWRALSDIADPEMSERQEAQLTCVILKSRAVESEQRPEFESAGVDRFNWSRSRSWSR